MKFIEVTGNLFDTDSYTRDAVVFAHCIASDFGMFGGIATQFIERFNMKEKLMYWSKRNGITVSIKPNFRTTFGSYKVFTRPSLVGKSVKIDNTYNLITKHTTNSRPRFTDFKNSLIDMRNQMIDNGDTILAIPDMIGCGIDMLDRNLVITTIYDIFVDTDITVYAVKLK